MCSTGCYPQGVTREAQPSCLAGLHSVGELAAILTGKKTTSVPTGANRDTVLQAPAGT